MTFTINSIFADDSEETKCLARHLASKGIFDEYLELVKYHKEMESCNRLITNIRRDFFSNVGLFRTIKNKKVYDCMMDNYISNVQDTFLHYRALKEIGIGWRVWRYFDHEEKVKKLLDIVQESMIKVESHCNQLARNQVDFERYF